MALRRRGVPALRRDHPPSGVHPTEAERRILHDHAHEIAATCDAATLVELGSGTSDKTRTLLDAFRSGDRPHGPLRRIVPVGVSEATLRDAATQLGARYPGLEVEAVVGDFTLHLADLPRRDRRLVAFLGSTVGNLYVEERAAFLGALGALADSLAGGEWLLLGTDLVKDVDRIIAAYFEISTKFRLDGIVAELADAGFEVARTWTDSGADFALTLARRR